MRLTSPMSDSQVVVYVPSWPHACRMILSMRMVGASMSWVDGSRLAPCSSTVSEASDVLPSLSPLRLDCEGKASRFIGLRLPFIVLQSASFEGEPMISTAMGTEGILL